MRLTPFLLLLFLTACGPSYEEDVHLTPPPSSTGQTCTTQCMKEQAACNDSCQAGQDQCEQRARLQDDFDRSLTGMSYGTGFARPGFGTGMGFGYQESLAGYQLCQAGACKSRCAEHMYECYTQCGGQVHRAQRCVKNCPSERH